MATHKSTATPLGNMIDASRILKSSKDTLVAAGELAMGAPTDSRDLDVCWGFCALDESDNASYLNYPIIIGHGILRDAKQLRKISQFTQFDADDIFIKPGSHTVSTPLEIQNAVCFGNIWLESFQYVGAANPSYRISVALHYGSGQYPVMLFKEDITREQIYDALLSTNFRQVDPTPITTPVSYYHKIEIHRFALTVDYYKTKNGMTPNPKNRMKAIFRDMRKVRGIGGFAEEQMAENLTTILLRISDPIQTLSSKVDDFKAKLVANWADTLWGDVRSPTEFLNYWTENKEHMPLALQLYFKEQFGVTI
jgi:hypothetical protein